MSRKILKNKTYLYLTEFFAGMSVMAVELGASRLLAPYFSSSQIVWTIIIGTIMIAMALGNLYGGRKADSDPDPDKLYRRMIIAALWIAAIPVLGKYIILLVSGLLIFTINSNYLASAAFIACMIVFVFPLFLLGTVTPSLVKFTVSSLDEGGSVVGKLNAANTIGSILGTFLPTFVTIPSVGTAVTFLLFSGILILLCILYFLSPKEGEDINADNENNKTKKSSGIKKTWSASDEKVDKWKDVANNSSLHNVMKLNADNTSSLTITGSDSLHKYDDRFGIADNNRKKRDAAKALTAIVIFAVCCIFGHDTSFAFWQDDLTYEGESVYNYLQVYEDDTKAVLSTNVLFGVQSVYRKEKSLTGMYYDYAMAAPVMAGIGGKEGKQKESSILVLGMGTGTFATQCSRYFDYINIEGVEIDDRITDLAREYFAMPDDMKVTTYDGRAYLAADKNKYDVIMVDAYQDITIPFQMSSVEFFTMVRDHLTENGVMVVNMNMRGQKEGSINEYLADTIASVFPSVYTVDVPYATNRELFACCSGDAKERLIKGSGTGLYEKEVTDLMTRVSDGLVPYNKGNLMLTDDKAPVELLGMRVIDDIIRQEIELYRDLYETEGLEGLLKQL